MALNIRKFWQQNRPELDNVLEAGEFTANTTAAGLGLAIALGVANPAVGVTAAGLAFTGSARKVIEVVVKKWNKKLSLEEIVAFAAPLAYLQSFDSWTQRNSILAEKIKQKQNQETQVDSGIENLTLNEQLATNALRNFHRSELAQTFNRILSSQLIEQGLSQTEVEIIVSWIAWEAGRYLKQAVEETSSSQNLSAINIYKNTSQEDDSSLYKSIAIYLAEQIATKPKEKVFNEEFSFADIYVPLKAAPVDANGKVNKNAESFVVEDWAKEMLLNPKKAKQVMFIQGGPGRGKSVFCRMFADLVRQKIHPLWIPVLIRLRGIEFFEASFEKTLQGAVKADFARYDGWLTNSKVRFLFLLDGFDELRMESRSGGVIERFIKQVSSYQERCDTSAMGHRFIVTGRQLALQGISYLPDNLERVELLEMDNELQQDWLGKWQTVVNKDDTAIAEEKTASFQAFLQSDNLPQEVKQDLAREPLLLYLLAAMHRDGDIKVKDLEGTSGIQAKISIYEQALNWVLTEQRKPVQKEIVKLEADELSQVLIEAGLCVVQSGGECARIKMIEERLKKSEPEIVEKIEKIQYQDKDEVLKNALAAFYLKPAAGDEGGLVEFFHKSFGEFLCAKRIQQTLEDLTVPGRRGRDFNLNEYQLAEEIYDLLGYGGLTPEIMEYLWGLLAASQEFRPLELFTRLEDFYERWCDGEFIDADGTTLPQAKMRRLRECKPQFKPEKDILGQRQVDVYTGLNVMILLLELHRYGQQQEELKEVINFHLCGKHNHEVELEDSSYLFRIIGYSRCLNDLGFLYIVGRFLSFANLSKAKLSSTNLSSANLSFADLSKANLSSAKLSFADLSKAKLISAKLSFADLSKAKLISAKLSSANLSSAKLISAKLNFSDLSSAKLISANLNSANLNSADLSSANLSSADLSFADLIAAKLSSANLSKAKLISADLSYADLSYADLSFAKLSYANLSYANLSFSKLNSAKLNSADFSSANLSSANLIFANLSKANLSSADLSSADLSSADLSSADLSSAKLEGIRWNENTNWSNVLGLESAINVPEALRQKLLQ